MSKRARKAIAAGIGLAAIVGTAAPAAANTLQGVPAVESLSGLTESVPGAEALGGLTGGGLLGGDALGGLTGGLGG